MASIYEVKPEEFIEELSEELKKFKEIKAPVWAPFVKTGVFKEKPPVRDDWWYVRSAAILRSIAKLGPIGTSKLRRKYGGKKNRGVRPEHFYPGSGSIIRKILQQLEKAGLVKQEKKGVHKGRIITPKAASLLDKLAAKMSNVNKKEKVKAKPVKEKKVSPSEKEKSPAKGKPTKEDQSHQNLKKNSADLASSKKEDQNGKIQTSKQEKKTE
jgi:small subunit ribosomal protein S19e